MHPIINSINASIYLINIYSQPGYSYSDIETKKSLIEIYKKNGYIADPHGEVGFLGLKEYLSQQNKDHYGIFLETAHPVKVIDSVEKILKLKVQIPNRLKSALSKKKSCVPIKDFSSLKSYLLN